MIRKGILGAVLALAGVLVLSTAASAEYGDGNDTVSVAQGESIDVTGSGCEAGETVVFDVTAGAYTANVGSTTAGDDGSYATTVTIPADTPVGEAVLSGTCGTVVKVLNLDVTAAAGNGGGNGNAPINDGTLPRTGSDNTQTLLGVGAGFLLLGGALAVGARRTRRDTLTA